MLRSGWEIVGGDNFGSGTLYKMHRISLRDPRVSSGKNSHIFSGRAGPGRKTKIEPGWAKYLVTGPGRVRARNLVGPQNPTSKP